MQDSFRFDLAINIDLPDIVRTILPRAADFSLEIDHMDPEPLRVISELVWFPQAMLTLQWMQRLALRSACSLR
jgi:hypothetical protein